jgi:acetyl esterase
VHHICQQIDVESIGVGGDSAGGNLASAVALKARDAALVPPVAFQVLVYPCNDYTMSGSSYTEFAQGYGLTTRAMKWFWEQYLGTDAGTPPHAYAAPMLADSFSNLPPAVMVVAECDPLASDSESYSQALRNAGVEVNLRTFTGMNHGFIQMCAVTPRSHEAIAWIADQINALLASRK